MAKIMAQAITPRSRWLLGGAALLMGLLELSGIRAYDRTTWVLEIFPILVVLPILFSTYRRFPLTNLLYCLIFAHALILMVGGTYTYARVPFGFYLEDVLHLGRNPYDKIGHLFQGLVPAVAAREILLRDQYVRRGKMLVFLVLSIVMAISATYELLEWASALVLGQGADDFLGTQGDPWDTQSDMFCALLGGSAALLLFSRWHNRQLMSLTNNPAIRVESRSVA
jgi:putative membrane protein